MASLTCRRVPVTRSTVSRPRARVVVVKALSLNEAANVIGQAFVRIFSPPDDNVKTFPTNQFTGKISHHEAPRRPFKDGYSSNSPLSTAESSLERVPEDEAVGYVEDAVKSAVVGQAPITDGAPSWDSANPTGWKGDIHTSENKRDARDGFHAKKY